MSNSIKYSTTSQTLALRTGNYWIGTGDVPKGPTSSTDYWNGISPPVGGYTIYLNKASNGPSIYVASSDSALISGTNQIGSQSFTTVAECFNWYNTQSDKMVFNVDYPAIVTDGLVLNLDAGFRPSYTTSGVTWYDISSSLNNSTLINGITYSASSDGNLVFDGTDDYSDVTASSLTSVATIEMWANIGAGYSGQMFFGWFQYDIWCNAGNIGFNTGNSDQYGIASATVSSLGCVGNWKHYIFEMRSDVSYTNNKIYINGSSQTLSQLAGSENAANRTFNSGQGRIAGWRLGTSYHIPMNLGSFRIYNKSLTQAEVTQNYNATKSRFGL